MQIECSLAHQKAPSRSSSSTTSAPVAPLRCTTTTTTTTSTTTSASSLAIRCGEDTLVARPDDYVVLPRRIRQLVPMCGATELMSCRIPHQDRRPHTSTTGRGLGRIQATATLVLGDGTRASETPHPALGRARHVDLLERDTQKDHIREPQAADDRLLLLPRSLETVRIARSHRATRRVTLADPARTLRGADGIRRRQDLQGPRAEARARHALAAPLTVPVRSASSAFSAQGELVSNATR